MFHYLLKKAIAAIGNVAGIHPLLSSPLLLRDDQKTDWSSMGLVYGKTPAITLNGATKNNGENVLEGLDGFHYPTGGSSLARHCLGI